MYGQTISQAAHILAGGNEKLAIGLANVGDNAVASAIGGGVSSMLGGGYTNGASISSAIEQYNYGQSGQAQKNEKQLQNDGRLASITGVSAAIGGVIGTVAGGVVGIEGGPLAIATGYEGGTAGAMIGAAVGASISNIIYGTDDSSQGSGETSAMTAPTQPSKDDTILSTPSQERDPKDNVVSTPVQEHDAKDNVLSTPTQEGDPKDNIVSTPAQTPDKGDMIVTDHNAGGIDGARQDLIDIIGPSASLGKNDVIEIDGNGDQNQTAQDVVDKIIGNREVDQEKSKDLNPINGVAASKAIHLTDGTVITYRPAGAASSKTDKSTATI